MSNIVAIDFEFNQTSERDVNLVSCSLQVKGFDPEEYWLHNDKPAQRRLANRLMELKGKVFIAYAVEAEARSFLALGLNPLEFKWIDLYVEYRHLLNHNNKLAYGKQLIAGRVKTTKPPMNKWGMTEEDKKKADMSKPEYGMAAACFKLLNVKVDTAFKDATRDLIISNPPYFTEEEKTQIVTYCTSDIKYLFSMWNKMKEEYKELFGSSLCPKRMMRQIYIRSRYSCRTAYMVREGYPINFQKTKNFSDSVRDILYSLQKDINSQFPEIMPFELNRDHAFTWKQKKTKDWVRKYCEENKIDNWMKTKKKDLSLSLDAFEQFFPYTHDYPRGNFGAQIVRFLKTKRSLNGFLPKKAGSKKKTFWDSVGSDNRVRPYFGIYGSQSSRSQPSATGFLFLKSAWMRALCEPVAGRAITSIDFGSQEFLLSALLSKDKNMLDAYDSGDPYLYFAKLAGAVPWEGKKEDYKEERNLFKSTCLAKGSLIRVKGEGFLPIEEITKDHEVWDGENWRKSQGAKYMGHKEVLTVENISTTKDHRILTNMGWQEVKDAKKENKNGKIYFQDAKRLSRPSASWSEVWSMGGRLLRAIAKKTKERWKVKN